uniref:Uncharacterized protein n=1 Tax=Lepeophtheirus salmonis TaxID=72036 RepID=A0A0K2TK70_LEPSM
MTLERDDKFHARLSRELSKKWVERA